MPTLVPTLGVLNALRSCAVAKWVIVSNPTRPGGPFEVYRVWAASARITLGGIEMPDVASLEYSRPVSDAAVAFTSSIRIDIPFQAAPIITDDGWPREREWAGLRVAAERGRRIAALRATGRAECWERRELEACRRALSGLPLRRRKVAARALERLCRCARRPPSFRRCALDVWKARLT